MLRPSRISCFCHAHNNRSTAKSQPDFPIIMCDFFGFSLVRKRSGFVDPVDSVDLHIEVRSGTELGFQEHAVLDHFRIGRIVRVGIHIRLIRGKRFSAHREFAGVKHFQRARSELLTHFFQLRGRSFRGVLAERADDHGAVEVSSVPSYTSVPRPPHQSVSIFSSFIAH